MKHATAKLVYNSQNKKIFKKNITNYYRKKN